MKTIKYFWLAILIISLLTSFPVHAQISKGGTPPSENLLVSDSIQIIQMPVINIDSIVKNETNEDFSFRFGIDIDVNMGLNNSGTWDTLKNGDKIWRLKIFSKGAFSVNLIYDDFWLPEGAQFFVYNEDKSMILGAFTSDVSNNSYNKFSTDLVKGEAIILEYFEPKIKISRNKELSTSESL